MGILLIALYLAVLLLLCGYGLHRARLAWLCMRCQPPHRAKRLAPEQLPTVTVQLPIYNEATVVQRLLEEVSGCLEELRAAGTISANAQPVIVVVREKRRRLTSMIPGL